MSKMLSLGAVALAAAFAAAPGPVQPAHAATSRNNGNNAQMQNATPADNPLLAWNGEARASRIIVTLVYNQQDKQLGSVSDILLTPSGQNGSQNQGPMAVINVNDGSKLVTVPFNKLEFGNAKQNGDNKIIMPSETLSALKNMPAFHYNNNG